MHWDVILLTSLAYTLGSLNAAIIIAKLMGYADPREQGSNNPGATNMLRIGGKKAAALTLFLDALKGFIAVMLGYALQLNDLGLMLLAIAVVIGHMFPCFFHFKGGKGVATAMGVMLALSWQLALAVIAVWLLIAKGFRLSSLAAIIAAISAPFFSASLAPNFVWAVVLISVLVVIRHHSNISRLLRGEES